MTAQPADIQARSASYTIIRTRVFDDWLRSATECPQVVLLSAGFDTRAFRLGWPTGTRVWELDQATVLDPKETILQEVQASARCVRQTVACDLRTESWPAALRAAGFHAGLPTVWLAEGLLPYLEPDAVEILLRHVSALSACGSRLAADFVAADLVAARNAYLAGEADRTGTPTGASFRFGADDPVGLLAQHVTGSAALPGVCYWHPRSASALGDGAAPPDLSCPLRSAAHAGDGVPRKLQSARSRPSGANPATAPWPPGVRPGR